MTWLAGFVEQLGRVQSEILALVDPLPPSAWLRGADRKPVDQVWELTDDDLEPPPARRVATLRSRYQGAIAAVVDFAGQLSKADLHRAGYRSGRRDTVRASLERSLHHDLRYREMIRATIPEVMRREDARTPVVPPGPRLVERAEQVLDRLDSEQAFSGEGPSIADLLRHCSNKARLMAITRRMIDEEEPELGAFDTPEGFWADLRLRALQRLQSQLETGSFGALSRWERLVQELERDGS